jgi:collagenase-like PrtC family protease
VCVRWRHRPAWRYGSTAVYLGASGITMTERHYNEDEVAAGSLRERLPIT